MHRFFFIAAAFSILASPAAAQPTPADQVPAQQTAQPVTQPTAEAPATNPEPQAAPTPVPPPFPPMPSARPSHRWVKIGAGSGSSRHRARHMHQRSKSVHHPTARGRGRTVAGLCHGARHGHLRRHGVCAAPARHGHHGTAHRVGRSMHRNEGKHSRSATRRDRLRHHARRRSR